MFLRSVLLVSLFFFYRAESQRQIPLFPGLNSLVRGQVCIAESKIENDILKFQFSKTDGVTLIYLAVKDWGQLRELIGEDCWPAGSYITWHIHEKTQFGPIGIGKNECSTAGGHWDPTLACSPDSGNELCKVLHLPGSSALGLHGVYQCNPEIYNNKQQAACEVSDLSGKYGKLRIPNFESNPTNPIAFYAEDIHDTIYSCELKRKSIVFHCAAAGRALCFTINTEPKRSGELEATLFRLGNDIKNYLQYVQTEFVKY